jgi:hypothetical protein
MLKNQTVKLFLLGILTLVITMGMVLLLGKVTVGRTGSECNQTQCDTTQCDSTQCEQVKCDTTKCDQHVGK